jgi:hypothetical protein
VVLPKPLLEYNKKPANIMGYHRQIREFVRKGLLTALSLMALHGSMSAQEVPEIEALRVLDQFMPAFNAGDTDALVDLFHFPHIRIAGDVTVWDSPSDFM